MRCDSCEEDKEKYIELPYKPESFAHNPQPPMVICLDCIEAAQQLLAVDGACACGSTASYDDKVIGKVCCRCQSPRH